MSRPRNDFALVLAAKDRMTATLAADLLKGAGIPCMLHETNGAASYIGAEWGQMFPLAAPEVYVPRLALDDARRVLRDAWGERWEHANPGDESEDDLGAEREPPR